MTVNLCKDYNKSAWYRLQTPLDAEAEEEFCWEDSERELWDALEQLRPVYRTILYMFYYEGYKIKEIAQETALHGKKILRHARKSKGGRRF